MHGFCLQIWQLASIIFPMWLDCLVMTELVIALDPKARRPLGAFLMRDCQGRSFSSSTRRLSSLPCFESLERLLSFFSLVDLVCPEL